MTFLTPYQMNFILIPLELPQLELYFDIISPDLNQELQKYLFFFENK